MIDIDGSILEGGGQLLRMATSYSAILGEPIRVYNIRAKRRDPGLKPQHLTTLRAASKISGAKTKGAFIGSSEIVFQPRSIRGGEYSFDIGTAGSISLLLQCINPILLYGDKQSRVFVKGGTAVNWSPPITFIDKVINRTLETMDASSRIKVRRHGFYPRGGGEVTQLTTPVDVLRPLTLDEPKIKRIRGISLCGGLPEHVAIRQASSARKRLNELRVKTDIKPILAKQVPASPGSFICLWAEGENIFLGADSLGARGKPAETVGEEAAVKMIKEVRSDAHLDRHTADHMILPLSLAEGKSEVRISQITLHILTAIEIAKVFTDAKFRVRGKEGERGIISVTGIGLSNQS
jgi:RNA 3'-terminal phosphate cyclase (ATP)